MNNLGVYLLVSLLFVFGTMVELAVVLIVEQKLQWDNQYGGNINNGQKCKLFNNLQEVVPVKDSSLERDQEALEESSKTKRSAPFTKIPTTTKMDIVAFLMFTFSYIMYLFIHLFFR